MLCFRLEKEDNASKRFLKGFRERLEQPFDLFKMPFSKKRLYAKAGYYCLQIEPAWPPLHLYALVWVGFCVVLGFAWWAYLFALPFIVLGVFYTSVAYHLGLMLGLYKAGSGCKVVRVKLRTFLEGTLWAR